MSATSKSITFKSTLTPEQLRVTLESIHSPILTGQSLSPTGSPNLSQVQASVDYFRRVNNIIRSLDRFADKLADYNFAALEYDRSAARIQRLSTANVDPELVDFANTVAQTFFGMASALRGVPREAAVQVATTWDQRFFRGPAYFAPGWDYPWRWGSGSAYPGYAGVSPVGTARGNIGRTMADEANLRRGDWLKIRELQRTTNTKMTNKYGVDFMQAK
jgi:hypothetical protein